MHNYKINRGLSMVELLVALALSSFLLLGVTTIFLENKRGYVFQQNQSENIEASRFAAMLLQDQFAKAGYRRRPDVPHDQAFPASNALGCDFSAGETAKPFTNARDAVCMRYQPRTHADRDCLGNLPVNIATLDDGPYIEGNEVVVQRFYLDNSILKCEVTHIAPTVRAPETGDLLTGVADLWFEYGTGTTASPQLLNEYTVDPSGPVIAVRYAALLRSTNPAQRDGLDADAALEKWRSLTGLTTASPVYQAIKATDDGQIYQISQSAIMLRNLMP